MAGSQGTLGRVALVGVECEEAGKKGGREGGMKEHIPELQFTPPSPFFPSLPPSLPPSASTVRITYTRQASVDDGLSALKQACHYPTPPPSLPPSPPRAQGEIEGEREGGREGGRPDFVDAVLFREKGKKVGEVAGALQVSF